VALACHVPLALQTEKELGVKEWFNTVCEAMRGEVEIKEETDEMIIGVCKGSKDKELFPLKMRDAGSSAGYQMLLKRGLIPQDGALTAWVQWPPPLDSMGGGHIAASICPALVRHRLDSALQGCCPLCSASILHSLFESTVHACMVTSASSCLTLCIARACC
jgi:hypothetical protein